MEILADSEQYEKDVATFVTVHGCCTFAMNPNVQWQAGLGTNTWPMNMPDCANPVFDRPFHEQLTSAQPLTLVQQLLSSQCPPVPQYPTITEKGQYDTNTTRQDTALIEKLPHMLTTLLQTPLLCVNLGVQPASERRDWRQSNECLHLRKLCQHSLSHLLDQEIAQVHPR